ncbi:MAG: hypothetical protein WCO58_00440 [bacterium]
MKAYTFVPGTGIVPGIVAHDPDGSFVKVPYLLMGNTASEKSKILFSEHRPPAYSFKKWIDGDYKKIIYDIAFYEVRMTSGKKHLVAQRPAVSSEEELVIVIPKEYGVALSKDFYNAGFIFMENGLRKLFYAPKLLEEVILIKGKTQEVYLMPQLTVAI